MQRLFVRGHVDYFALPPGVANDFLKNTRGLIIDSTAETFRKYWTREAIFIFVGSLGAAVRLISPFLTNKENDPAVLVMDARAENIVPLIGGHYAGAEDLASQLSEDLGSRVVFTGFSAVNQMLPIDSFGKAWGWKRNKSNDKWSELMIRQAKSLPITFRQETGSELWRKSKGAVNSLSSKFIEDKKSKFAFEISSKNSSVCGWHPPVLWVGIGCERGTSADLLEKALDDSLQKSGLTKFSIAGFASIDLKSDEQGLLSLVRNNGLPINFYSSEELSMLTVPNPSDFVQAEVGTGSVAEAAALLAAGQGANLKLEKQVFHSSDNGAATFAIAESLNPYAPQRGELHLIGSGPGNPSFLTQDARFALSKSVVWFGYKRYLDLLEPLRNHLQVRVDGSLTNERERCIDALDLAQQGAKVALISSGDSGIYGMAGLALELWLDLHKHRRPSFDVHPGISALQMAAARIGAPLMHDFCVISLSDCLTSWEKIEMRLEAAAKGDFVVAIYNPRSKDRHWQLEVAIEIFLKHRSPHTKVLLARQLARAEESVSIHQLGDFPVNDVDMLSILLVGNESTYLKDLHLLTPRGY